MIQHLKKQPWIALLLSGTLILSLLLAACGGANSSPTSMNSAPMAQNSSNGQVDQHAASMNPKSPPQQYLIKSLNITMEVKDTQKVANDLQAWMSTTDPLSTAQNIDYQQVSNNLFNVSMSFSVQASLYPRIESYINNYPAQHNGRLISTNKNTQDVSGDYVDTQSRLKNLRGEQERLLTLLSHASVLGDILAIDQRLTDVEGQIEQIEAHLNQLNGQTSFYTIAITLQPSQGLLSPPPAAWSLGQIWQTAVGAAWAFAQILAVIVIWLVVFSIYIIPLLVITWLVIRWRRGPARRAAAASPKVAS